mgnify:FL=1
MKVLDLHCRSEHVFEGWFASEEDFQSQLGKGLVQCPLCGDDQIQKRLSAPRLNLRASASASAQAPPPQLPSDASQAAAWLQRMRQAVAQSEDVGERFTEEARKMHWGEADQRPIRGQANIDQTLQLLEEGIPVLPLPPALKEPLQ